MAENQEGNSLADQKAKAQEILERSRTEIAEKHVKTSRNTLYVLAALFFLYAILYGTGVLANDIVSLVFYSIIAIIYILLALWTKSKPQTAVILGLVLYLLNIALIASIDINTLYQGWLIKGIIITYLVRGILEARKIPKKKTVDTDTLDGGLV
ncbi:hypothetical protein JMN32_12275 [Fulvivirga sp. 29W222]|uniref:Uncharacterized protein n=1 Tax=Fulvivirga marina TaxID=2494733 RepID=A0A937FW30_9BACT|nr:hypothetical protein [Fulvivirga marina]MBL6447089.1 hypothetical protein [Fulvivirga marina]